MTSREFIKEFIIELQNQKDEYKRMLLVRNSNTSVRNDNNDVCDSWNDNNLSSYKLITALGFNHIVKNIRIIYTIKPIDINYSFTVLTYHRDRDKIPMIFEAYRNVGFLILHIKNKTLLINPLSHSIEDLVNIHGSFEFLTRSIFDQLSYTS